MKSMNVGQTTVVYHCAFILRATFYVLYSTSSHHAIAHCCIMISAIPRLSYVKNFSSV